jgi:hypothetical protein
MSKSPHPLPSEAWLSMSAQERREFARHSQRKPSRRGGFGFGIGAFILGLLISK